MESFQAGSVWVPLFPSRKIRDVVKTGRPEQGAGARGPFARRGGLSPGGSTELQRLRASASQRRLRLKVKTMAWLRRGKGVRVLKKNAPRTDRSSPRPDESPAQAPEGSVQRVLQLQGKV